MDVTKWFAGERYHMKRLLCIVSSLSAGGAETFLMKLYRQMDRTRYQMDFIVSGHTNSIYEDEVRQYGGYIYEIPLRTRKPVRSFLAVYRIVKDNGYRYVLKLSDTPEGIMDLLAAKAGGAGKISVRSCNSSAGESRIRKLVHDMIRPFFVACTDQMIAPSRVAAAYTFGKKRVRKAAIVHNAVCFSDYTFDKNAADQLRDRLGLNGKIIIGHIGRFTKQKNHDYLIDIFQEIHKINADSILFLAGAGEEMERIKARAYAGSISKNVIFYGITRRVDQILSLFDVFVLPSLYEGLPNVIVEAQSVGVPCLVADTVTKEAGLTPLVHFMSLKEQPVAWAVKALSLAKRSGERKSYQQILRKKGYDIERVVDTFLCLTMDQTGQA